MSLLYSVLYLSIGVTLARLALLAGRQPRQHWWTAEGFTTFVVIVIVGLLSFGVAFLADTVFGWERQVIGLFELAAAMGIMMSAAILWVVMDKLLAAPSQGNVVSLPEQPGPAAPDDGHPAPHADAAAAGPHRRAA